jgi:hypothetical protein
MEACFLLIDYWEIIGNGREIIPSDRISLKEYEGGWGEFD